MAIAVELTQLGLPPDRVVRVLNLDPFPLFMAARMAARALIAAEQGTGGYDAEHPGRAMPMYLRLDPSALADLTLDEGDRGDPTADRALATFFYGGPGVIADMIQDWTEGDSTRGAFINVTRVLDLLVGDDFSNSQGLRTDIKLEFWNAVVDWSTELEEELSDNTAEGKLFEEFFNSVATSPNAPYNSKEERDQLLRAMRMRAKELAFPDQAAKRAFELVVSAREPTISTGGETDVDPQA